MAGFGEAATVTKIGTVLVVLGFLLNVIGFGAPYWTSVSNDAIKTGSHSGLWQTCSYFLGSDTKCQYFTDLEGITKDTSLPDWFEAVRTFEAIAFIASLVTVLFIILYTCVSKTSGNKILALLSAIVSLGTGGCILLGVIIYGSKSDTDNLSWAFALCTVGGVFYGIAGILLFVSICAK